MALACLFARIPARIFEGVFYFIPSNEYQNLINNISFDVFFNCASLSEMDKSIAFGYINTLNKIQPKHILHCNSNYLAFPNSKIHVEILAKDFPIDSNSYKLEFKYISPFQGASGRYRIFYYKLN